MRSALGLLVEGDLINSLSPPLPPLQKQSAALELVNKFLFLIYRKNVFYPKDLHLKKKVFYPHFRSEKETGLPTRETFSSF